MAAALLQHDDRPAHRQRREQAERSVLVLTGQRGSAVADGQSSMTRGKKLA